MEIKQVSVKYAKTARQKNKLKDFRNSGISTSRNLKKKDTSGERTYKNKSR